MALYPYTSRKDRVKTVLIASGFWAFVIAMFLSAKLYDPSSQFPAIIAIFALLAAISGVMYIIRDPKVGGK